MTKAVRVFLMMLALALVGVATLCADAVAQPPQVVKWEIEATIIDIADPNGYFPDVRLGDPVRGTLRYDVNLWPNPLYSADDNYAYTNYAWFDVATMVIENPRTEGETRFVKDTNGDFADVNVVNDLLDEDVEIDGLLARQSVLPPPGFTGTAPVVAVVLYGPPTTFPNLNLPTQLNLDDWPIAGLAFFDAYHEEEFGTSIEAEIYSLTPVPVLPGDFDSDGDVDVSDYNYWRATFGDDWDLSADGNGDEVVDAADYTVWRDHVGQMTGSGSFSRRTVPEPATLIMSLVGMLAMCAHRRAARTQSRTFAD